MYMIWNPTYGPFRQIFRQTLKSRFSVVPSGLFGLHLRRNYQYLFIFIFKFSRTGVAMRATANDQQAGPFHGRQCKKVFALSWSLVPLLLLSEGS